MHENRTMGGKDVATSSEEDVEVTEEKTHDVGTTPASISLHVTVADELVKLYKESHLAKCLLASNGRKSLYTVVPLPSVSQDFKITLLDDHDGIGSGRFS
ncbi:hypothetical protein Tco_0458077 [Tanacetum coccineum]